jgi:hypothetical protein
MEFPRSSAAVGCTRDGWVLRRPKYEEFLDRFDNVCAEFGADEQLKLAVPQQVRDGDRIQTGARSLRALHPPAYSATQRRDELGRPC